MALQLYRVYLKDGPSLIPTIVVLMACCCYNCGGRAKLLTAQFLKVYWGYIRDNGKENGQTIVYWEYIEIMENEMETTII